MELSARTPAYDRVPAAAIVHVAVVEENEILRRGIVGSLAEDPTLDVHATSVRDVMDRRVHVAVVSADAAQHATFPCPIVINVDATERVRLPNDRCEVAATLRRGSTTAAQLRATVHAAAAGLRVSTADPQIPDLVLDARSRLLLELLAEGCGTREIAERMNYSERTIKKLISALQEKLNARGRAHLVAQSIRRGLI